MKEEIKLMKGNEAIAHAAIRYGADGYFGYPITPQSEVMETLMEEQPWETTGMVVLQAESEVAAINMVYGGASCGKAVMTTSSKRCKLSNVAQVSSARRSSLFNSCLCICFLFLFKERVTPSNTEAEVEVISQPKASYISIQALFKLMHAYDFKILR